MDKIDHIALEVEDVGVAIDTMKKNFTFDVIERYDDWAIIQFDNIKVALVTKGKHPPHVAFSVKNRDDLLDFPGKVMHHRDGTSSVYVMNIPGNWVEYIFYPKK